jgi:hypothetical protein
MTVIHFPEDMYGCRPILFAEVEEAARIPGRRFSVDTSGHPRGLELGLEEDWSIEDYRREPGVKVEELPPYSMLVIAESVEAPQFWLFECDETFKDMADSQHKTLGEAKLQAGMIYGDVNWREVPA